MPSKSGAHPGQTNGQRSPLSPREQRRYMRFGLQIGAKLSLGRKAWQLETDNISAGGLFLRAADAPGLRQLVRVQVALPTGEEFDSHAMVAWRRGAPVPGGHKPGIGLQ